MKNEIVKIDHAEYGLEESKAKEIEALFRPMLAKMTELEKEYNSVIRMKPSEATCTKAHDLRLKYVKIRTGTAVIHKVTKEFYLRGGKFVDGWKNAQLFASQGLEGKLMQIEQHFENLEKERKEKLQESRSAELEPYGQSGEFVDLGSMDDTVWNNYFSGVKLAFDQQQKAEKKAKEDEEARLKVQAEQRERMRLENERLRKEKEAELKRANAERKVKDERFIVRKKILTDMGFKYDSGSTYNFTLKDVWSCYMEQIFDPSDKEFESYIDAIRKAIKDHEERAKQEAKLALEREAKEKLEAELRKKEEAEEKARIEAEEKAKAMKPRDDLMKILDGHSEEGAIPSEHFNKVIDLILDYFKD